MHTVNVMNGLSLEAPREDLCRAMAAERASRTSDHSSLPASTSAPREHPTLLGETLQRFAKVRSWVVRGRRSKGESLSHVIDAAALDLVAAHGHPPQSLLSAPLPLPVEKPNRGDPWSVRWIRGASSVRVPGSKARENGMRSGSQRLTGCPACRQTDQADQAGQ